MQWPKTRLGDLYEVHNGLSKPREAFGSGWPFLSYSVVFNNFFLPKTLDSLVQSTDKEQTSYSIKAGDIFVTRTSETPDELGMSCVALKDYPHATYNGFCKRLRPTTDKVHPGYIGYYLRTHEFRSRLAGLGASMITRASLRNEDLLSLTVSIPPLAIQQSIAERLARYDALIENNARRIAILETKAEQLYKEWFVRRRFPGHTAATSVALPTGWSVARLGDILEVKYGKDHKSLPDGNIPIFGSGGIMRYGNRALYDGEAVLIPRKGSLNNIMFFSGAFWTVDTMFYGLPKLPFIAKYLYMTLLKIDMASFNTGAALPSMTTDILNHFKVTLPEPNILESFDKQVTRLFALKDNLQRQNALLARERDLLLPRLMSGRMKP